MNISCNVITDLLPLYHDGVCNESTRELVEGHLQQCGTCGAMLEKIRDNTLDRRIAIERGDVVSHHTKAVKKKSLIAGISIASVMAIPVLVSMIVNIATGNTLDWFFIVLTSLMVLASVTVVPLIFEKNKGLWTLGSFTGSLMLLLLTISIFSRGDWFFVASVPVLFGLSVMFAPFVAVNLPLTGFISRHRGLLVMAVNSLLLYAVIIVSGLYAHSGADYWRLALLITTICLVFPWSLFLTIRYLNVNALVKTGLCLFFSGLFFAMIEDIVHWTVAGARQLRLVDANLLVWELGVINANISLLMLLVGGVGGVLAAIGLFRKKSS